jgi:hypothetical protein
MSIHVDNGASEKEVERGSSGAAAISSSSRAVPMVRCNTMPWTDETEGQMKVLVTRSDPVTGTAVTTEGQVMPLMALTVVTGTPKEALHGAQLVAEAVASDAARSEAKESQHCEGGGARSKAPVQEG